MDQITAQSTAAVAQPQVQPQSQGQSLDPSIVALTKAIGQAESGGKYTAPSGDKGSQPSAYQFTPGFTDKWGPTILGSSYKSGQQLTPEQQDELAYGAVKTMGTTGDPGYSHLGKLSPAQIASAWNAGDPNAYLDPNYGKNNAYGSTANYVQKVQQNYEKDMPQPGSQSASNPLVPTANASSGSGDTQSSQSSGPSLSDWLLGGGVALGGWLLGHAKPIAGMALTGGGEALGAVVGGPAGAVIGGTLGSTVANDLGLGSNGTSPNTPPNQQSGSSESSQPQPDVLSELDALQKDMPQANKAAKTLADAQTEALGSTILDRQMAQDPQIQAGIEANSKYNFAPEIDEQGGMNYQPAIQQSKSAVGNLSNGIQKVLAAEGAVAPMQHAVSHAKEQVRQIMPSNEWDEADKYIDEQAKSYTQNFGDGKGGMSLGHFQQMKQEQAHGKKWGLLESNAKKQAAKHLAHGARRTIEEHTKHKELYNRVMKEEQKLINGQKVMKRLNGKKAPKNHALLRQFWKKSGQYLGLVIGDKIGGPLGAVLGSMVGDYVVRATDKKYGKTVFETPAMHKALDILRQEKPNAYKFLEHELKKAGITPPREKPKEKTPKEVKKGLIELIKKEQPKMKTEKKGAKAISGKSKGFPAKGLVKLPSRTNRKSGQSSGFPMK